MFDKLIFQNIDDPFTHILFTVYLIYSDLMNQFGTIFFKKHYLTENNVLK